MERIVHYELNICGGDFQHVQDCFEAWKREPLVYRQSRPMFEGKQEVRCLTGRVLDNGELAQGVLARTCSPDDPYALAIEVNDGERDIWLVMAAHLE
ncbi:hypothetical protein P3T40_003079 [Paraburkholderia sp. EB58]|jgi:hypothetical protein|uniref:hypothetical protein n=1 Tax=Paraburkholderia sp. EB58 TaxID=3035125 RepID=UPI003D233563